MDRDTVLHREILRRAADRQGIGINRMRKCVKNYLHALGTAINESDPERDIRVHNLGVLRVRKHEGHKGRDMDSGEQVKIPAYRSLQIDPAPRIDNVLKAPLKEFYDLED